MMINKLYDFLTEQGINPSLLCDLKKWRATHLVTDDHTLTSRLTSPHVFYQGKEVWEMALAALLEGENILLLGPKATGKNILSNNLSFAFGRPQWDVSFHMNTDSSTLIGMDTFRNNEVVLRAGSIYECAVHGGFAILDEINMAKNEAMAVLHSVLDYRRTIDVPGYDRIVLHPCTRFIATMNYGYAGTKELNEALVSRFMVIEVPQLHTDALMQLLSKQFPTANKASLELFAGIFYDLQQKAINGEISTKCVDLRGIFSALHAIHRGLSPQLALQMGITAKSFDEFEKQIVADTIHSRIPNTWGGAHVFST